MLKFSQVVAFVAIVFVSAFLLLVDAARTPKWNKLTRAYSYGQYLADTGKKVPSDPLEYAKREKLFLATLRDVMEHNAKPNQLYKKGINQFADWTKEEFKRINGAKVMELDSVKLELQKKPYHSFHTKSARNGPYPNSLDWRNTPNVISTVKDQGQCGSCWAHGSTETLEAHYAIATGELFVLSQQEVTACAPNPNQCGGTGGCGGSIAQLAFQYIIENGGQTQEWEYPYTAYWGTTGSCNQGNSASIAKFSGFKTVATNDQDAVMDALISAGPLAVNVDASNWNTYESGIYNGCNYANNISIDHVVQLVGWGVDAALDNTKYWTIRNSWNAGFGEQGYIRLIRHDTPECGWNVQAQDGTACKGQPSTQWTCGQCGVLFDTSYPIASVPPKRN